MYHLLFTALFQTLMSSTVSSYLGRKHDFSQRRGKNAWFNIQRHAGKQDTAQTFWSLALSSAASCTTVACSSHVILITCLSYCPGSVLVQQTFWREKVSQSYGHTRLHGWWCTDSNHRMAPGTRERTLKHDDSAFLHELSGSNTLSINDVIMRWKVRKSHAMLQLRPLIWMTTGSIESVLILSLKGNFAEIHLKSASVEVSQHHAVNVISVYSPPHRTALSMQRGTWCFRLRSSIPEESGSKPVTSCRSDKRHIH